MPPGESGEHLQYLVEEERRHAAAVLVELREDGVACLKHIDGLVPEDMPARLEAESARVAWLTERTRRVFEETRQRYHRQAWIHEPGSTSLDPRAWIRRVRENSQATSSGL